MTDWKDKLKNSELYKSGGDEMKKPCKVCGEDFVPRKSFHTTCDRCHQPGKKTDKGYDDKKHSEYLNKLKEGYFDENNCLRAELLTTLADEVAQSFGHDLKNHQLRRFYDHAKAAQIRLKITNDWNCVKLDIKKLSPFVSEARGKKKIPESFYNFIEENVKKIVTRNDFEAFVEHFQAVVAYFTFRHPKN